MKGINHSEHIDIDGRLISEWILKMMGRKSVDWIHLALDRDQ
jgi:hypothetical protein